MDATLTWKHAVTFTGIADSKVEIPMDTTLEHGGSGEGATPMELILMGLGGCTAMDVISILQKKRLDVRKFEIVLHAERALEHPKVFTDITIEYVITGRGIDRESVERAIDLSETKYCSGMAMLRKAATIKTSYRLVEV
jgi:putative redox protein